MESPAVEIAAAAAAIAIIDSKRPFDPNIFIKNMKKLIE